MREGRDVNSLGSLGRGGKVCVGVGAGGVMEGGI